MRHEVLDLLAGGITQGLDRAEVGGVGLDQVGIELMLADHLAEAIAHRTTAISVGRLRRQLLRLRRCLGWFADGSNFFNGANSDSVGLAQSTVNGASFRYAHFSAVDKKRDIGRIGVAVTDEVLCLGFEYGCLENPTIRFGVGNAFDQFCRYAPAAPLLCESQQAGMSDIPSSVQHK